MPKNGTAMVWLAVAATPDHDDFGSHRSKIINVIDSHSLERDLREKPVSTFSHPALALPTCGRGGLEWWLRSARRVNAPGDDYISWAA